MIPSKACRAGHSNEPINAENGRARALSFSMVSFPWHRGLFLEVIVRSFRRGFLYEKKTALPASGILKKPGDCRAVSI